MASLHGAPFGSASPARLAVAAALLVFGQHAAAIQHVKLDNKQCKVMCQRFGMKALGPEFAKIRHPNECTVKCDEVYPSTVEVAEASAREEHVQEVLLQLQAQITDAGRSAMMHPAAAGHDFQLVPPSTGAYMLSQASKVYFSQWGQERKLWDPVLARIDGLRQKGYKPFFVESGARDGEEDSNTLFLERSKSWNGLLVEPSDREFPKLQQKGRHCWAFHGAISPTNSSVVLEFFDDGSGTSHLNGEGQGPTGAAAAHIRTLAAPLQALLGKVQPPVSTVDFWSLDIEGSEGPMLESTDFNKIEVGVLMIEMNKGGENNLRVRKVMDRYGFKDIGGTTYDNGILDHVFVNPKYFEKRGLAVPYLKRGRV